MDTKEFIFKGFKMNGFLMLFLHLIVFTAAIVGCFVLGGVPLYVTGGVLILVWLILCAGYMELEPNEARANTRARSRRRASIGSILFMTRRSSPSAPATSTWNPSR